MCANQPEWSNMTYTETATDILAEPFSEVLLTKQNDRSFPSE